jgi:hypothetical protein
MSKAGKAPKNSVGTAIPNPEKYIGYFSMDETGTDYTRTCYLCSIPHSSPSPALNTTPGVLSPGSSPSNPLTSPIKEHPNSHPVIHPSSLSQEGTTPETTQKAAVEAPISVGTDNAGPDSTAKDAEMEI